MKTTIIRKITAAAAALIAASTLVTGAGAATYTDHNGNKWSDGINDGKIYEEDINGVYRETVFFGTDIYFGNVYYNPGIGYYAFNGGTTRTFLGREFTFTEFVGTDPCYGNIYFNSYFGYFTMNGSSYVPVDYYYGSTIIPASYYYDGYYYGDYYYDMVDYYDYLITNFS